MITICAPSKKFKFGDFCLQIREQTVGPFGLGLNVLFKENVGTLVRRFLNHL